LVVVRDERFHPPALGDAVNDPVNATNDPIDAVVGDIVASNGAADEANGAADAMGGIIGALCDASEAVPSKLWPAHGTVAMAA
jgi:hypothetical protein